MRSRPQAHHPDELGEARRTDPRFVGFSGGSGWVTLARMWSDSRAAAARREMATLAGAGLTVAELYDAAIDVVASVVPFDAACWGSVDPESNIVTSGVTRDFAPSPAQQALYAELEASGGEPNALAVLAARRTPAARLTDVAGARTSSVRWNDLYRPLGIGYDLRTPLRAGGRIWGVAELFRAPGALDFDDREVDFVSSVADVLGAAARAAVLAPAEAADPVAEGPALLVVAPDGTPEAVTPAAEAWIERAVSHGPGGLGMALRGVVGSVVAGHPSARARCRIDGRWVALHASPLRTRTAGDAIAVSIEPATTSEMSRLLLSAHGLSDRERDVCEEVLAGRSSKEIAARLFISTHTVQDHLKAVFAKVGVSSRRELVASLRPDA